VIDRHAAPLEASRVLILPPSQALAERVLFFVVRNARGARDTFDLASVPTWQSRFPANMYSTLTFVHGGALHDAESGAVLPSITVSGLMTRAVLCRYVDAPETTVVVFRPGALTDLMRLPAAEFSDAWINADSLWRPSRLSELHDRIGAQRSVARRIHALESFLMQRFAAARGPSRELARALQSMVWELPHLSVNALAERFGSHPRALQRRFRDAFGASPRWIVRLARLQLALWYLQRRRHRLVEVARLAGYADAAHLTREVRELVGVTPSRLMAAMRDEASSSWALTAPQDTMKPRDDDSP